MRDWEKLFVHATRDMTLTNTCASMERIARELGQDRGVTFEYECFDIGHLYSLRVLADRGLVKPPFFIQSVFGFLGGLAAHPKHVMHFRETADMLFGDDYYWSVLAAGKEQIRLTTMSAVLGGNVRVGLEDNLYLSKGVYASNEQLVTRARTIIEAMGARVLTAAETRERLRIS